MSRQPRKKSSGRWFLLLFSLPFAGVGIFMAVLLVRGLWEWQTMKSWVEVPATILAAELETHSDSDSTTYLATARYRYTYQGRDYESTRVGIHAGADNIGSSHEDRVEQLQQYLKQKRPFRCFVNPENPGQAILYRELRFAILAFYTLFMLVFGGVGFGLMFWSFYSARFTHRAEQLETQHPEQAWMWKEDWAAGRVKASTKSAMITSLLFAVFWNLLSAPVLFFVPDEVDKGNNLALIGLLFPLVGMGLLVWAFRCLLRWLKYGESTFELASVPGVIGGQLAGVVHTNRHLEAEDGFQLTLSCVNRITSGSGKNRSTRERVLWQEAKVMSRELARFDLTKSAIPVQFLIPYDAKPTSRGGTSNEIIWRLDVVAAVPGIDYTSSFEVPVFITPESSPDFEIDESPVSEYESPADPLDSIRAVGVRIEPMSARGLRVVFPMCRNLVAAFGITAFFAIWTAAIALMIHLGAPLLFPIVFTLFDLLIFWGVLDLWFWSSRVEVSPQQLNVSAGLFGIGPVRRFDAAEISEIKIVAGMQAGNRLYHQIKLVTENDKQRTLGKAIPNKAAADAIADQMREVLTGTL